MIRPDATAFVPLLGKALKSPDRWVRQAALEALFAVATWSDPSGQEPAGALRAVLADDRRDRRTEGAQRAQLELESFSLFHDRKRAVEALAKQGPAAQEKAVAQLAGDLRDLGSPRSYEAALLLPRLRGGTATLASILLDFIRDGDDTRRRIAMILLGPTAGPAEATTVLRAITAPGAERKINLRGRLRWWESVGAREGSQEFQRFVQGYARGETTLIEPGVQALKVMGEQVERRAIGELIATLREPGAGPQRRCCAIIALGEFGPDAVEAIPALEEAIRAHEAADRGASRGYAAPDSAGALATRALGKIAAEGSPEAIAILARLVADPKASVAPDAAWVLILLGPKARPAVPALVKGLKEPRQVVRADSAQALGKIGGPDVRAVLPALLAALDDENGVVRYHAAGAVAQYGAEAKAAVPRIVDLLWESADPDVVQWLGGIGPAAVTAIPPLLYWEVKEPPFWGHKIRAAMERIMPHAPGATVAGSIAAMKAGDPAGRTRAVYEVGRLIEEPPHPAEAVAALGEALGDPDSLVRRIAAAMLGRLAPTAPNAGPLLSRAARDPDESVRRLAAWGLGRAGR
jgi:HEAT repeat protein